LFLIIAVFLVIDLTWSFVVIVLLHALIQTLDGITGDFKQDVLEDCLSPKGGSRNEK